jgi:hypothetical protein
LLPGGAAARLGVLAHRGSVRRAPRRHPHGSPVSRPQAPECRLGSTLGVNSRSRTRRSRGASLRTASTGLVANSTSSGIPAARHRPRFSVQEVSRYNSWSINARPAADELARNTPIWQFSIRPAVPEYAAAPSRPGPFLQEPGVLHGQLNAALTQMLPDVVATPGSRGASVAASAG